MGHEARRFPRINVTLKIAYELTKWNDIDNINLHKPNSAVSFDISANGIGLINIENFKLSSLKDLHSGKLKFRIGIYLNENQPPLITFARIIWCNEEKDNKLLKIGLTYIDFNEEFFENIKKYVDDELKKLWQASEK